MPGLAAAGAEGGLFAGVDIASMVQRSTASGWILCIIGLFGIWRLYVIARPKMRELEQNGEEKLRSEMWKDIAALKDAKADMSKRISAAEAEIAANRIEIGQQRFILNLVITELEVVSPGNAIARQARLLMDAVQPAAFVVHEPVKDRDLMDTLNETKGAGE